MRISEVAEKTGLSKATIWRLSNSDLFPRPLKISSGCTAWLEHELDEWLDAKAAARAVKDD